MILRTDGIVIREQTTGEQDRLVTILTRENGVIKGFVNGGRNPRNKNVSSTGLLCYSDFSIEKRKNEVDELLAKTNKNIEANIERENALSQRKIELNAREMELNSKLSEAEVIFLNIKPLIKGLNKIKEDKSSVSGGNNNE